MNPGGAKRFPNGTLLLHPSAVNMISYVWLVIDGRTFQIRGECGPRWLSDTKDCSMNLTHGWANSWIAIVPTGWTVKHSGRGFVVERDIAARV